MVDPRGVLIPGDGGVTVRFERSYRTTPADLWSAVTDPERLARWLGPVYLRAGGRYELRMGDDVPSADQNATGEVRECDEPNRLVLTWSFPGEQPTLLEVEIRPADDGAVLVLQHQVLTEEAARGYGGGWHATLDQLGDHVADRPVRSWTELFGAALPAYRGVG